MTRGCISLNHLRMSPRRHSRSSTPFTRLVHVWSGFGSVAYLARPYQVVRARRLNVPAGHNQPRQPGAGV